MFKGNILRVTNEVQQIKETEFLDQQIVPVWSVCFSSVWFGVRLHHQISSSSSVSAPRCFLLYPRLQILISSRRPQQHLAPLCASLKKCQTSARIRSGPESRTGAEPSRTNRRPRFLSRTPCSWSWTRLKLSTWSSKSGSVFPLFVPALRLENCQFWGDRSYG